MSAPITTTIATTVSDVAAEPHITDAERDVAELIESGTTVTVERADGKTATGTLAPHPTDPDLVKVVTGRRGRPFTFHPIDLVRITTEQ
jgi:hypothetical protein